MTAFKRTFGFIHQHPLAKKHLYKSYFNFLRWQIRSAFNAKLISNNFIHDIKIFAKKGMTGVTGNIYTGLHEFNEMGFLLHFLVEEDRFIDVGANAGSYTLLAAGVRKAQCYSFEPVPATYQVLQKNIKANHLESLVTICNAAIGGEDGYTSFSLNFDATNHVLHNNEKIDSIQVKVLQLDNLFNIEHPFLLKIDVEGFETEVIRGATRIIENENLKAIIIELIGNGQHYGFDEEKIHQQLISSGFWPYAYDPFKRKLHKLAHYEGHNTIYIRDLNFVKNRINQASAFSIFGESI